MTSWLAFLFTLSLIILVHEWGHFVMARRVGVRVERFSFGFGPLLVRWVKGGTEYVLSLLPFGGYVKLAGENPEQGRGVPKPWEYRARSVGERSWIVLAGPLINYGLGFLLFFMVFVAGAPVTTTRVGQVLPDYPAAEAGLKSGDRILAVNGQGVTTWEEMTQLIQAQTDRVVLTVERDGRQFPQEVRPKVMDRKTVFGRKVRIAMVGITHSDDFQTRRYPVHQAFLRAAHQIWFLTTMTLYNLWAIVTGALSLKESFTGPIGIFYITSAVADQGAVALLQLVAVLSTSIGLFNLLPIPVLDGGHLVFLTAERLRGRPVSLRVQEMMTRVGLGFLLLLLAVVTYNDLLRFGIGSRIWGLFRSP